MLKRTVFILSFLCFTLNIYGQDTYKFLDSISNEPITGVAVISNDSIIAISNTDGVVRIDRNIGDFFSARHSLYYQKKTETDNKTIILSPRYQFLDEFTVKGIDYFDLYEVIMKKNRNRNKTIHKYVKCNYYKQMVSVDQNLDTSKMKFSATLYVDLTDLESKVIYVDNFDKVSFIQPDKIDEFYNSTNVSHSNRISFEFLLNQFFFPEKKLKKRKNDADLSKYEEITNIRIRKTKKKYNFDRRLTFTNSDSIITSLEYFIKTDEYGKGNTTLTTPFFNVVVNQADSINIKNSNITSESEIRMKVFDNESSIFGFQYIVIDKILSADEFELKTKHKVEDFGKFIESADDTDDKIIPLVRSVRVDF